MTEVDGTSLQDVARHIDFGGFMLPVVTMVASKIFHDKKVSPLKTLATLSTSTLAAHVIYRLRSGVDSDSKEIHNDQIANIIEKSLSGIQIASLTWAISLFTQGKAMQTASQETKVGLGVAIGLSSAEFIYRYSAEIKEVFQVLQQYRLNQRCTKLYEESNELAEYINQYRQHNQYDLNLSHDHVYKIRSFLTKFYSFEEAYKKCDLPKGSPLHKHVEELKKVVADYRRYPDVVHSKHL